ncbi:insulin-like peptide [Ptychodera flava]|uniref:insulin-like peptide n=1 Tax=Ptychodera flava TaxID=63121 RepID=UPI00396A9DEB
MDKNTTFFSLKLLVVSVVTVLLVCTSDALRREWHCGRTVETMQGICRGCYAQPSERSTNEAERQAFIGKEEASSFTKSVPTIVKRGLLEDCCYRRCNLQKMMTYCCAERQRELNNFFSLLNQKDNGST